MSALWIAFGILSLLLLAVRLGWHFGYGDGYQDGRRERRGHG